MTPPSLRDEDKDLAWELIRAARRSTYTMTAGSQSSSFLDADDVYFGRDDLSQPLDRSTQREHWAKRLSIDIASQAVRRSISRLAFLEKVDSGPVGMLTWM